MAGSWGRFLRLSIFGESHGAAIGVVVDGLPPGLLVDEGAIAFEMARRAPGWDAQATARQEADAVRIVSGVFGGRTTGTPICGLIENADAKVGDYDRLGDRARPGHADATVYARSGGHADRRGGGHASGRLTAPIVFAGALARILLRGEGVAIGAHIASIGGVEDRRFDPVVVAASELEALQKSRFPLLDPQRETAMREAIRQARDDGDSVGGAIECAAVGVPGGWGSPFFDAIESAVAHLLFAIPGVKGVDFGDGFALSRMRGSQANDPLCMKDGAVASATNHSGGVDGGIANGRPIVVRVACKPTPSIAKLQRTVDLRTGENAVIEVAGRHDPCIVPRALPVVEAAMAIALCDAALEWKAVKP